MQPNSGPSFPMSQFPQNAQYNAAPINPIWMPPPDVDNATIRRIARNRTRYHFWRLLLAQIVFILPTLALIPFSFWYVFSQPYTPPFIFPIWLLALYAGICLLLIPLQFGLCRCQLLCYYTDAFSLQDLFYFFKKPTRFAKALLCALAILALILLIILLFWVLQYLDGYAALLIPLLLICIYIIILLAIPRLFLFPYILAGDEKINLLDAVRLSFRQTSKGQLLRISYMNLGAGWPIMVGTFLVTVLATIWITNVVLTADSASLQMFIGWLITLTFSISVVIVPCSVYQRTCMAGLAHTLIYWGTQNVYPAPMRAKASPADSELLS